MNGGGGAMTEFMAGLGYALRGFRLIRQPGLRRYAVVPALIGTLLFAGTLWWGLLVLIPLIDGWVLTAEGWLPGWLDWLTVVLQLLLWLLFGLGGLIAAILFASIAANLLAAPFNGLLAARVEERLGGVVPVDASDWREIAKVPVQELRKLGWFAVRAIPLLLLSFVPVLQLAAPALWLAFGAWMMAIEYLDYPMANHGIDFEQQRERLRSKRALALGFGLGALFLTSIPIVNFIAMPAAVAGGTALWRERLADAAGLLHAQA